MARMLETRPGPVDVFTTIFDRCANVKCANDDEAWEEFPQIKVEVPLSWKAMDARHRAQIVCAKVFSTRCRQRQTGQSRVLMFECDRLTEKVGNTTVPRSARHHATPTLPRGTAVVECANAGKLECIIGPECRAHY